MALTPEQLANLTPEQQQRLIDREAIDAFEAKFGHQFQNIKGEPRREQPGESATDAVEVRIAQEQDQQRQREIMEAGLAQGQDSRGLLTSQFDRLNAFADAGPGPSLAQAQLLQAQDQNIANAQSLAAGARGTGGQAAAMRQAQQQAAVTGQQTAQTSAILRAQEQADFRGQQLAALGQAGQLGGTIRQQDLGTAELGQGGLLQTSGQLQAERFKQLEADLELERIKQRLAAEGRARDDRTVAAVGDAFSSAGGIFAGAA